MENVTNGTHSIADRAARIRRLSEVLLDDDTPRSVVASIARELARELAPIEDIGHTGPLGQQLGPNPLQRIREELNRRRARKARSAQPAAAGSHPLGPNFADAPAPATSAAADPPLSPSPTDTEGEIGPAHEHGAAEQ